MLRLAFQAVFLRLLQRAILSRYDLDEILERPLELLVPATDLLELFDTEFEEEQPKLLSEISYEGVVTVQQVELEPERHYFVVEVRAWLDEFDVQVLWRVTGGRGGQLYLLLDQLLLVLLHLVDEVMGHFEDYCDEGTGDGLLHHVFKLYLLTNQIYSSAGLAQKPRVKMQILHAFIFLALAVRVRAELLNFIEIIEGLVARHLLS